MSWFVLFFSFDAMSWTSIEVKSKGESSRDGAIIAYFLVIDIWELISICKFSNSAWWLYAFVNATTSSLFYFLAILI